MIRLARGTYAHFYIQTILLKAPFIQYFAGFYVSVEDFIASSGGHHIHTPLSIHEKCLIRGESSALWWGHLETDSCVLYTTASAVQPLKNFLDTPIRLRQNPDLIIATSIVL